MNLLSYQLFDHCSVEHVSPCIEPTDLIEPLEVSITEINPSTGLELIDNCGIDVGGHLLGELIDDIGVNDALDVNNSLIDISDCCSDFSTDTSIEHDSSSGFMLIEDNFVSFDDDHGASSWGDEIDLSMNADF